jgi:histidinol-phosphate aminotransferase
MEKPDQKNLARTGILDIKPYVPGRPLQEVKREYGLRDVIKLASNENALGPSPLAVTAIRESADRIHLYPDAEAYELRNALSRSLSIKPDYLILGNGGEEIVTLIGKAFINQGERCIIPYPVYDAYETIVRIMGGEVCLSDLSEYRINLDDVLKKIDEKTKLVFICNPMNPTGTIVTQDELDRFLRRVPSRTVIVLDEAYCHFVSDASYPDGIDYVREGRNVIVLRTFSKVYGLGGIRIGYGVAKPELVHWLRQVKEPFNVNALAQIGALAALQDDDHVRRTIDLVRTEKAFLYQQFSKLGLEYVASETNFIFVNLGTDATAVFHTMLEKGIIIRPGHIWGYPQFIRLTIGTRNENEQVIQALQEILPPLR